MPFRYYILVPFAKVFINGGSQAIRLPKGFRLKSNHVFVKKMDEGLLLVERDPWEVFEEGCRELSETFMSNCKQPHLEKRACSHEPA